MKPTQLIKLSVCLLLATLLPRLAIANIYGPYAADNNTLFLLHFDEAAGSSVTTNNGSKAGNFYTMTNTTATAGGGSAQNGLTAPPLVTTLLGYASFSGFGNAISGTNSDGLANGLTGYDGNKSGAYSADVQGGPASPDAIALTNLNIGNGGASPFTLEALICPSVINANQEIICTDDYNGSRGFQFKITSAGQLQFQTITAPTVNLSIAIPTTGTHAFVPNTWYHVAVTYDGTNVRLYWTKLDASVSADNQIGISGTWTATTASGAVVAPLIVAGENRGSQQEAVRGLVDEVRISSVARAANQMQFFSPTVTISQNPVSQNVDYNLPVTFNAVATSLSSLGYQWRFNLTPVAGATNTSYSIASLGSANAGNYDVIVTNTSGNSATSTPAILVVGASHYLAHRYNFTNDDTDSIGGATGTNFGNATVTGGALVLDGTTGTFMQLPPGLITGLQAVSFDFWATYGTSGNNSRVFDFGNTNGVRLGVGGQPANYVFFSPHTGGGTHQLTLTGGGPEFEESTAGAGALDGRTVHVTCVVDPPNKTLAIYTNGVLESAKTNVSTSMASLGNYISYVGRSLYAELNGDAYLNASIDEFRIYNGALAAVSIKQSDDQGPNTLLADGPGKFVIQPVNTSVPAGQNASFTAAAIGYLPMNYQWFRNGSLIPGATNASYSFTTVIGDNGATFLVHATNVIGVTTYVTNSVSATLSVFIPPTLAWQDAANGGADSAWNTTSINWTNELTSLVAFAQTNGVRFDSRGSGSPTVDVTETITPYNVTVDAASDYVFTSSANNGALIGQAALTKLNSGKLTLDVTNNLSGAVTISGGTLQIGNGTANGSLGSGSVTNNATLAFNRSDTALNVGNAIHGSGTLSFDAGSVTVSGNNDFSGSTLVNAGVIFLTSATGLGAPSSGTTVANGAQLYLTANVNLAEPLTLTGAGDGAGALRKGAAGLTVQTAPIVLAADTSIGVDTGATLTLSNGVSGTAALSAIGAGTLTLNTNNTFNGGFTLNGPVVGLNAPGALGTGPVTVSGNGRFVLADGLTITNDITANVVNPGAVTGLIMVNNNTNGTVTTVSGPLAFGASPTTGGNFAGPTSSGYLNVLGPVTTGGALVSVRFGNVRFSGGGSYSELQVRADTTSLGANNGVPTNAVLDLGGNGSPTVPTYFDLNGFNQTVAGLKNTVTPANLGVVTNSGGTVKTLTLDLGAGSFGFGGYVAGKVAVVLNAGSQSLSGTNDYSGNTVVNGGTLAFAVASLSTNSTVTVASGATLQLDFAETNRVAGLVLGGLAQTVGVYNNASSPTFLTGVGSLEIVATVNLTPTNLVSVVTGNQLVLSWPTDHLGWRLQSQTNSLTTGLGTNWVDVAGSATVTSVTNTIDAASGSVFYRMVINP